MKIKTLLLFISAITLMGCTRDNFLDFQPIGIVIPSELNDYRLILDQVESNDEGEGNGFTTSHFEAFYMTDNISLTKGIFIALGLENSSFSAYTFQDRMYLSAQEDPEWRNYYNQIYMANVVFNGVNTISNATDKEKNSLKAEARLHRAFAYFNLVNLYSVHYNPQTAASNLGVPIRDGIELEGVDLTRASVQQVYDYIIEDITLGYSSLPNTAPKNRPFRPSKAGASGLLAKVYLYQAKYDLALKEVDNALGFYNTIRDMNADVQPTGFGDIALPLAYDNNDVVWYKSSTRLNIPSVIVKNEFIDVLYEENDLRSLAFEPLETLITSVEVEEKTDYSFYGRTYNRTVATGINTPELLLIKAECEARIGTIEAAKTALNTLRSNRFKTGAYIDVNITKQAVLLNFIKKERRRELLGEPQRLFDLKRYNTFDNANITLTHEYDGISYSIPPNSLNWVLPIAEKYILLNPEIKQNPRD